MSKYEVGDLVTFDDPDYGLQRLRVDAVRDDSLDASRPVRGDSRSWCYTIRLDHPGLAARREREGGQ